MFDQLKAMGALAGLVQNKDRLRAAADRVRASLDRDPPIGQAGGGAVRAAIDGKLRVRRLTFDPALAAGLSGDGAAREEAERLIAEAVNDGLERAKTRLAGAVQAEAKALGIDELPFDLGKLFG